VEGEALDWMGQLLYLCALEDWHGFGTRLLLGLSAGDIQVMVRPYRLIHIPSASFHLNQSLNGFLFWVQHSSCSLTSLLT
jgi:hypothetical protein